MCDIKQSNVDVLQEIVQLTVQFQTNLKNVPVATLKTKYERSWSRLVKTLSNNITYYFTMDMHREIPNFVGGEQEKELYVQFLCELLESVKKRYFLAVKEFSEEELKKTLIQIRTEVLEKEMAYCMKRYVLASSKRVG